MGRHSSFVTRGAEASCRQQSLQPFRHGQFPRAADLFGTHPNLLLNLV
jgi:hypothetical protein